MGANKNPEPSVQLLKEVHEMERLAIAGMLTENINQVLVMARMLLENTLSKKETPVSTIKESISMLTTTINDLRYLTRKLQPGPMLELGLHVALQDFMETIQQRKKIRLSTSWDKSAELANEEMLHTINRIIQEYVQLLTETCNAREISLSTDSKNSQLEVRIKDNGDTFDQRDEHVKATLLYLKTALTQLNGTQHITRRNENRQLLLRVPLITGKKRKAL